MAYIAVADFRIATVAEYCQGITLTTSEASDTPLTAAITRLSTRFDDWVRDHFESEALTLDLNGTGKPRLYLPKRVRQGAAFTVSLRDTSGVLTAQATTDYRVHGSLLSDGSQKQGEYDWLDVIPGQSLTEGAVWTKGEQTVRVVGTFSNWSAVPGDVKRAVALLVFEHIKPSNPGLRRADRAVISSDAGSTSYDYGLTQPSGIPEVDQIVEQYRRPEPPE